MSRIIIGLIILIFTSWCDFPLMLIGGEVKPHWPADNEWESEGSFYHHGKGFWASLFRRDGEWWSKLSRFLVFWLSVTCAVLTWVLIK